MNRNDFLVKQRIRSLQLEASVLESVGSESTRCKCLSEFCWADEVQVKSHEYRMLDKHWGKNLMFQDFSEGMQSMASSTLQPVVFLIFSCAVFFNNGVRIRRRIAHRMLELLKPIARMMESVKYRSTQFGTALIADIFVRFYASSILFIYEGLEELPSDAGVDGMEEPAHEDHIESDAQVVESIDPSKVASQGQHTDSDPNFDSAKNAESIQKEVTMALCCWAMEGDLTVGWDRIRGCMRGLTRMRG